MDPERSLFFRDMDNPQPKNRLGAEKSPYLLQHAGNPVDWYPWGEEAFARARAENRPVFLSVGYATCHWCHVMERESFENEEIAGMLNRGFVAIKVDREERPDIDSIYMQAVQLMTGHGGWPMSVFLTPDCRPFFAGTYFPPDDRHGMIGFKRVLAQVDHAYRSKREQINAASEEVTSAIASSLAVPPAESPVDGSGLDGAARRIAQSYDPDNGGFGHAPKFPPSMSLDFLMQVSNRSGDATLRDIVVTTLRKMARGGMYDQVGGGFHRYSVDERWLVPHFEKMLYDNALLARLYVRAWQWTKDPFFSRVAQETLGFVSREMTSPEGGFYSTLDADSEGVEGKFYVWDREEVVGLLGQDEGRVFCTLCDISEHGNWEHRNILNVPRPPEEIAADLGISLDQLSDIAGRAKCKLYGRRAERVWPGRDEKILAGWNGWMLAAFAEAVLAFDQDAHREVVRRNADFLIEKMFVDGRLMRTCKQGVARIPGLLEDYSGVAWGLALAFEATHDVRHLEASKRLAEAILERFSDERNGGFFDTPSDHEKLISRPRDVFDNATPSGNSVTCDLLLRLALMVGEPRYEEIATRALDAVWPLASRYPSSFGFLLGVAEWRHGQPKEIAITGNVADDRFRSLQRVVGEDFRPHRVLIAGPGTADLPLMQGRVSDRAVAYVCEGYACQEPTDDPARLRALLAKA
jgi:uncharacterized protein YyaL (SSP411 family)